MQNTQQTIQFEENINNLLSFVGILDQEVKEFLVCGDGELTFKDKKIIGKIFQNKLNGKGTIVNNDGTIISGWFTDSQLDGFGCININFQTIEYGKFSNLSKNGEFLVYDLVTNTKQIIIYDQNIANSKQQLQQLQEQEIQLISTVIANKSDFVDYFEQLQKFQDAIQQKPQHQQLNNTSTSPARQQHLQQIGDQLNEQNTRRTPFDTEFTQFEGEYDQNSKTGTGTLNYGDSNPEHFVCFVGQLQKLNQQYQVLGNGELTKKAQSGNSTYTVFGTIVDGYLQGIGKRIDSDGTTYEGVFKNSLLHGNGKIIEKSGEIIEGSFLNGLEHGEVTITCSNYKEVNMYDSGEIVQQLNSSRINAKLVQSVNDTSVGDLENAILNTALYTFKGQQLDLFVLIGKLTYLNNATYKWFKGKIITLKVSDNKVYVSGQGTMLKLNKNNILVKLTGEFCENELNGQGEVCFENGDVYKGEFKNSALNGYGSVKVEQDNVLYNGEFIDNELQQGEVIFKHQQQKQYGTFKKNSLVYGEILTKLFIFKGDFQNGLIQNGHKQDRKTKDIYNYKNGQIQSFENELYSFTGQFKNNLPYNGTMQFKSSLLNQSYKFVQFNGEITELQGIFVTGVGSLQKYDSNNNIYTIKGQIKRGFLFGRGERQNHNTLLVGDFIESLLNGYGEILFQQENFKTCGLFNNGVLQDGVVINMLDNQQLESVRKVNDNKFLIITQQYKFLGQLKNNTLGEGIITFSKEIYEQTGIMETSGTIDGLLSKYQFITKI